MTKIKKGEIGRKKPLNLQEHQTVQNGNWGSKYGESWGRKTGEQEKGDPGFQGCGAWCGVGLLDPVNSILFSSFDTRAIVLAWSRLNHPDHYNPPTFHQHRSRPLEILHFHPSLPSSP